MANQKQAHAPSSGYTVPLLINGAEIITNTTFHVVSPVTESAIWKSSSASVEDAIDAVNTAQAAFPSWSKTNPSARREIILKAADVLVRRADELIEYLKAETAATDDFGHFLVRLTAEQLRHAASITVADAGYIPVCGEEGTSGVVTKEPYGVVLGIAPWYLVGCPCNLSRSHR
jgi:acyl-CoA reductase-like NAD-dependent aldehyde dehydrogenase